ncbi:MAG: S1C family serine protease [Sarcina sp.]
MSDFDNRNENEEIFNDDTQKINMEEQPKKDKKKASRRVAGTVAIAMAASLIGGGVGAFGVYDAMSDSKDIPTIEKEGDTKPVSVPEFKSDATLTIPQVVEKVSPAVVGVSTKSLVRDGYFNGITEQEGIGSGFIISEDGLVVTNNHVIAGAQEVKVILHGGEEVNAKVVNFDAKADLAVLQITDKVKMPGVAKLGDSSKLLAGQSVIAIGNPLGKEFSETVTSGIISSPNRRLSEDGTEQNVQTFIQTDTAINPGNSGGPLINANGEIIGVNTAKKVGEEIEGIGFSIPINTVKEKLGTLSKPQLVMGVSGITITPELAKQENLPEGFYIKNVTDFSPAEKAGLRPGDVITAYNGVPIKTHDELEAQKAKSKDGDVVDLTIVRNGQQSVVKLTLKTN